MGIEDTLMGAYWIGTQDDIQRYVQLNPSSHQTYLAVLLLAEFGAAVMSNKLLPDNKEYYVAIPLFADLAVRWGAGVINSVRNYVEAKKSKKPVSAFIDFIPHNPGLVGRIRELVHKI